MKQIRIDREKYQYSAKFAVLEYYIHCELTYRDILYISFTLVE